MQDTIRVVLVEDNPGDARLIHEMLLGRHHHEFSLDACPTLKEGLALAHDPGCDVMLLDLSLPDASGLDTLLQAQAARNDTAIIVLTGTQDQSLGVQALQEGAQDYLVKGDVDAAGLRRAIRYAIERHRMAAALRRSAAEYRSLIDDVFDTSMVAVIIVDGDLNVVWCNEATEIYFGVDRERIIGLDKRDVINDTLKCVFADPDDYANRMLDAYTNHTFTERFECHVLPGLGRDERWLEHWDQPIRAGLYAGGRIAQYTDITDRKLLEFAEQEQRQFAEALADIITGLTGTLDLEEVLDRILANVRQVVPHELASITLVTDGELQIVRQRQDARWRNGPANKAGWQWLERIPELYELLQPEATLKIDDLTADPRFAQAAKSVGVRAYAGVPIYLEDNIIGFINLFSREAGAFTDQYLERLTVFAEPAAVAIRNARLYSQSLDLAAMQERQRLARDLHDSVSQTLFTASAMAESALRRWDKDPSRAHELMADVHNLTTTALSEMRILLLELRPESLTRVSLRQLFEQYLVPIQNRRQFELDLAIDEDATLPPDQQIAFYRIAQEALNNIDKHAFAAHVSLTIRDYPDRLTLTIQDDGVGFNLDEAQATSLGLGIMQERAESIGADLHLTSEPDHGTQLSLTWYKHPQEG